VSLRPSGARQRVRQPHVRARLFGELAFFLGEKQVPLWTWRSKKAVSLLALLVHHRGDPVHREQAMEALWPTGDPERARKNLNVALTTLRRGLEKVDPDGAVCIRRQGAFYRLAPELIDQVDVLEFLRLRDEAFHRADIGDLAAALAAAERARALVVSDYLTSELYAEWAIAEREHLRQLNLDLTLRQAEWLVELDRPAEAARSARDVLDADPVRKRAGAVLRSLAREARR
jgi:SARP family transcriptional regulator, regulator of embCAB operon